MDREICILVPVFNDWENLNQLIQGIRNNASRIPGIITCVVVNDGSHEKLLELSQNHLQVTLINLSSNIGHQKAIACGLSYIHQYRHPSCVIVMDGDGQDRPEDLPILYEQRLAKPGSIVTVVRGRRPESLLFKAGYLFFRFLFLILTGKKLGFGNFSLIPGDYLDKLVYRNELWNHFPATILKTELPVHEIKLSRNSRLSGKSKMNYTRLFLHGMGAFLVFLDTISAKLVLLSFLLVALVVPVSIILIIIKLFTTLAIPGWTSMMLLILLLLFIQGFMLAFFMMFLHLTFQSQKRVIPALHYQEYILNVEEFEPQQA